MINIFSLKIYKILFFICLSAILLLSITPHPNSEVVSSPTAMKTELNAIGSFAYIGEESIGSFSDKYRHLMAFWTLAFLFDLAYKLSVYLKAFLLIIYGVFIELVQYLLPYRDFDIYDVLFNIIFIFTYYLSLGYVSKIYYQIKLRKY